MSGVIHHVPYQEVSRALAPPGGPLYGLLVNLDAFGYRVYRLPEGMYYWQLRNDELDVNGVRQFPVLVDCWLDAALHYTQSSVFSTDPREE